MLYRVESYLGYRVTEDEGSEGIVKYNSETNEFIIWPEYAKDENGYWVESSDLSKRIILDPVECLLLAINILFKLQSEKRIPNLKSHEKDVMAALKIAIDANIPIAHYFMASALKYFNIKNKEIKSKIKEHYKKAIAVPLKDYPIAIVNSFNKRYTYISRPDNINNLNDAINSVKKCIIKTIKEDISNFDESRLLRWVKKPEHDENTKAVYFIELGRKAYNRHDNREALKYYLLAESYNSASMEDLIEPHNYIFSLFQQFPEFEQQKHYLKKLLKAEESLENRIKIIDLYFVFNDIYKYLHDNKDKKDSFGCEHEKNQLARQRCFMDDINILSQCNLDNYNDTSFHTHVVFTGKEKNFNAKSYGFFKGTQQFQDLRMKLYRCISGENANNKMTNVKKVAGAFNEFFNHQKSISNSFPAFLMQNKTHQEIEINRNSVCLK